MRILKIENIGSDCYKIAAESAEFFLRAYYLKFVREEELCEGAEFLEEREEDLIFAGLAFAAEKKAVSYLERCEQCRAGLQKKLAQKNFEKAAVEAALDYLERRDFLSDARFARAWLNSHRIAKPQGRARLSAELASRGISRQVSENALREFFEESGEEELCARALKKRVRERKSGEKLVAALIRDGFSYKMIRAAMAEFNEAEFEFRKANPADVVE